jgi:hypothetical protein
MKKDKVFPVSGNLSKKTKKLLANFDDATREYGWCTGDGDDCLMHIDDTEIASKAYDKAKAKLVKHLFKLEM